MKLDTIYCADARHMEKVEDDSVQLIVTSPPYNVGKPYENHEDAMGLETYLTMLDEVWRECQRVLCRGGRLAVNVANTWRQPYLSLVSKIDHQLESLDLLHRGHIIWDKGASVGVSTAWGSFARASNPVLRDVHEYITVWSKGSFKLEGARGFRSGISNNDFAVWTRSVWQFPTEAKVDHPAPFPVELPRRLIRLYSNEGDVVLDPFMGSGSTAIAAREAGRHFIGYEISPEYRQLAYTRLDGMNEDNT